MITFYTCSTCHNLNGAWRLHCQTCGTVPAQYSMTGKAEPSIIAAYGCLRSEEMLLQRVNLRTVEHDYYAGA